MGALVGAIEKMKDLKQAITSVMHAGKHCPRVTCVYKNTTRGLLSPSCCRPPHCLNVHMVMFLHVTFNVCLIFTLKTCQLLIKYFLHCFEAFANMHHFSVLSDHWIAPSNTKHLTTMQTLELSREMNQPLSSRRSVCLLYRKLLLIWATSSHYRAAWLTVIKAAAAAWADTWQGIGVSIVSGR